MRFFHSNERYTDVCDHFRVRDMTIHSRALCSTSVHGSELESGVVQNHKTRLVIVVAMSYFLKQQNSHA